MESNTVLKSFGSDSENFTWSRFLEGNDYALGDIMRKHYITLFNYGTRFTKDKELVKDCIQDLFLGLWKNRQTINNTVFVKTYLLKSLRRKLSKSLNGAFSAFVNRGLSFDAGFDEPVEMQIIRSEDQYETSQKIRKILATLSRREQEVIYLRFYENVSYAEIAGILFINKQSAYNLLHEALTKLRKYASAKNSYSNQFFSKNLFKIQ